MVQNLGHLDSRATYVKQICTFILATVYLYFIVGATIHHHYCMGEYAGSSLFSFQDKRCGKCGMVKHGENSSNCCNEVSTIVKLTDSHTYIAAYDFSFFYIATADLFPSLICNTNFSPPSAEVNFPAHSPPFLLKNPLFIQYNNFRI